MQDGRKANHQHGQRVLKMQGETIRIAMADGYEMPVYHVTPTGPRRAGLVLVQEIFGVTDHIRELCDEYAAEGFEVLSPNLFDREEPGFAAEYAGPSYKRAAEIAREEHDFAQSLADTARCIDWLKDKGPVFIVGYCYGGSVAWRLAQTNPDLAAASSYYGGFVASKFAEDAPLCPTIVHFGRFDSLISMDEVPALIERQHPTAAIFLYEAGHGFNSDRRKDYHPESADLALKRTLELFAVCGAG
jgi:carboxymethylenebutenolidase